MTEELAERDRLRQTRAFPIVQGALKVALNSGFDEGQEARRRTKRLPQCMREYGRPSPQAKPVGRLLWMALLPCW